MAHLFPVTDGLLEGLDDQGSGRGDDGHLGHTVLDRELAGHAQTLPLLCRFLGNVLTNLLGRQTQGTDLGRQRGSSTDLATFTQPGRSRQYGLPLIRMLQPGLRRMPSAGLSGRLRIDRPSKAPCSLPIGIHSARAAACKPRDTARSTRS